MYTISTERNTLGVEQKHISPGLISIIVIVLIASAAGTAYFFSQETEETDTISQTSLPQSTLTDSNSVSPNTQQGTTSDSYRDGEYSATGSYVTPGGSESVKVTVTLSDGTITNVSTVGSATRGDSAQYQSAFLSGYKSQVVGKSIDEVSLSRVSGSSLTSGGFNRAIEIIRNDARS